MALDASSSLGAAIGLQGVPKDYTMQFEQLAARKDAIDANKEAKKAKALDDSTKRAEKKFEIKPGLYLDKRKPEVEKMTSDFYQMMRDKTQQGINLETDTEIQMASTKLQSRLNELKQEHIFYNRDKNDVLSNPKDYSWDAEMSNRFEGEGEIPSEVYIGGAGKRFNGDTADHFTKVGKGIGKDININEYMNATEQVKNEITKVSDYKNLQAANTALVGALSGTDLYAKLDLERIENKIKNDVSFGYANTPEEQKKLIEDAFIKEKIAQFENAQDFRKARTITPNVEKTKREWTASGGGAIENNIYRISPSNEYNAAGNLKEISIQSIVGGEPKLIVANVDITTPQSVDENGKIIPAASFTKEVKGSASRWKREGGSYRAYMKVPELDAIGKPTGEIYEYPVSAKDYNRFNTEVGITPYEFEQNLKGDKVTTKGGSRSVKKESKERMFIVEGKAYKESALKKQGYDINTLKEFK